MPSSRPVTIRRAAAAALAAVMIITILPAAVLGSDSTPEPVKDAEQTVLNQMNVLRARYGLAPLRMAPGVRMVARDRSRDMRSRGYFDHVSPTGDNAGKMLSRRGVGYAFWGENIGWTVNMGLDYGARWMVDWWKDSPGHRANMLSRSFNYVGIGIAQAGAKLLYTMVFVNQRDHTPPTARILSARHDLALAGAGMRRTVTVTWWGRDRRLSTRTAGLKGFIVQHKKMGQRKWTKIRRLTTARQLTTTVTPGYHKYRVRAKDRLGNKSRWQDPIRVYVP